MVEHRGDPAALAEECPRRRRDAEIELLEKGGKRVGRESPEKSPAHTTGADLGER